MKKFLTRLMVAVFSALAFVMPLTACGDDGNARLKVYAPDGAPAVALAGVMDSGLSGMSFTVVAADAAVIASTVSSGKADIAIMPIDKAAQLYVGGADIVMLSVNTHGNLYIVGKSTTDEITLDDLKGKKLGTIGAASVPALTLRMLLDDKGIEYQTSENAIDGKVAITYAAAPALMQSLGQGELDYALLAEPAVTTAVDKFSAKGVKIVMDIQDVWLNAFDTEYPQACLVAQGSVVEKHKSQIDSLLAALKQTDDWAAQNPDKALEAVSAHFEKGGATTLTALSAQTVQRCNIETVPAAQAKDRCETYFQKLYTMFDAQDNRVLERVPDANFYYQP